MASNGTTNHNDKDPQSRLCIVKQWPDFSGFGFNLTSKSGRPGHFVEGIDQELPAYYSGLRNGDKIIEVNSEVITSLPHSQVAERIKKSPNGEVKLLVVDRESEEWFVANGIKLNSVDYIQTMRGPATRPKVSLAGVEMRNNNYNDSSNYFRFSRPEPPTPDIESSNSIYVRTPLADVTMHERPMHEREVAPGSKATPIAAARVQVNDPYEGSPTPRLCVLKRSSTSESYGFMLRTYNESKDKTIQFNNGKVIVSVDNGSVASRSGLNVDDHIIEVDGINVASENHRQVCVRIGERKTDLRLLVLRKGELEWYNRRNFVPKSTQPNVQIIETMHTANGNTRGYDNMAFVSEVTPPSPDAAEFNKGSRPSLRQEFSQISRIESDEFLGKLTARELREQIEAKKVPDPRRNAELDDSDVDFKAKHQIVDNI